MVAAKRADEYIAEASLPVGAMLDATDSMPATAPVEVAADAIVARFAANEAFVAPDAAALPAWRDRLCPATAYAGAVPLSPSASVMQVEVGASEVHRCPLSPTSEQHEASSLLSVGPRHSSPPSDRA